MNDARVEETGCTLVPCPCGCDNRWEQHDGVLHYQGGGAYFRALLMREADTDPTIWFALVTPPSPASPEDINWLITIHGNHEGARIEDPEASPVTVGPDFIGRKLRRDELMAVPGAPAFYFDCVDALMLQHSRFQAFVHG
jgi:hypothetical protein